MDNEDIESTYDTPRQFAKISNIPESTLSKMRMRGNGPPYVKINRAVRYPRRKGLKWIASRERRSTVDAGSSSDTQPGSAA
jgi:predicted transcriptional regulator